MKHVILVVCGWIVAMACASAGSPSWWTGTDTRILVISGTAVNDAPANLGQLKNVASQAKKHLDANLPEGAGSTIDTMVAGFEPQSGQSYTQPQIDDFKAANLQPANLGQLKAVAKSFYDRLREVGYDTRLNLIAHGYPSTWAFEYPWDPSTPPAQNLSPALLGQLKMVFSFDVGGFSQDSDGDGLNDQWERYHGLNPEDPDQNGNSVADGQDDFDGDGLTNAMEQSLGGNPYVPAVADTSGQLGLTVYTRLEN